MAAHLALSLAADIQIDLDRRKPGTSRFTTSAAKKTKLKFYRACLKAKPQAHPLFADRKHRPALQRLRQHCQHLSPCSRRLRLHPKYGFRDYRGGGPFFARETAMRVAAGAIAKKYWHKRYSDSRLFKPAWLGLKSTWRSLIGRRSKQNPFFCPDASKVQTMEDYMLVCAPKATPSVPRFRWWQQVCFQAGRADF